LTIRQIPKTNPVSKLVPAS